MTLCMMLSTQFIIGQLTIPINNFVAFIQGVAEAKISIERLGEVLNLSEENNINPRPVSADHNILLKNASFRYDSINSPLTLKGINIIIPSGKTTAIAGTGGSGI